MNCPNVREKFMMIIQLENNIDYYFAGMQMAFLLITGHLTNNIIPLRHQRSIQVVFSSISRIDKYIYSSFEHFK
jgi:hypothetical protein